MSLHFGQISFASSKQTLVPESVSLSYSKGPSVIRFECHSNLLQAILAPNVAVCDRVALLVRFHYYLYSPTLELKDLFILSSAAKTRLYASCTFQTGTL